MTSRRQPEAPAATRRRLGRQQGTLLPLMLALLLVVLALGVVTVLILDRGVWERRGQAAAEAAALGALQQLQPAEYEPVPVWRGGSRRRATQRAAALLLANGALAGPLAAPRADDIRIGPTWVEVAVRDADGTGRTGRARARGVPAGGIAPGEVWRRADGTVQAVTGCLPLGLDAAGWKAAAAAPGSATWLRLGSRGGLWALRLAGSHHDPVEHVRFLGYRPGFPAAGQPPPVVRVGDPATRVLGQPGLLEEIGSRLAGRVVIAPLLDGGSVGGFARLTILSVDAEPAAIRVALAPSAVSRSALPGPPDFRRRAAAGRVPASGLVLVGRVDPVS